jgi:hypothetical protein
LMVPVGNRQCLGNSCHAADYDNMAGMVPGKLRISRFLGRQSLTRQRDMLSWGVDGAWVVFVSYGKGEEP